MVESALFRKCTITESQKDELLQLVEEKVIKRPMESLLKKLEDMAMSYPGVVKTYAIQAGRELRVIVGADKVNDVEATKLSYDLSRQIQSEMTYPGQIKVTVIRETRAINYAK